MTFPKIQTIQLLLSLRKISISNCVNIFGQKFDQNHHLVKTILQLQTQPNIKFEDTALYNYHKSFKPKTTNEALMLEDLENIYPMFQYPWGQFNKYRKKEKPVVDSRFCGPTSNEAIFDEFTKIKKLFHSISINGYNPLQNRAIIFGTKIIKNNEFCFIPMQGNHRISILAALNHHNIYVGQHPNYQRNIMYFNQPLNSTQRDHNKILEMFLA